MIDLRDPLFALDFDLAVLRRVAHEERMKAAQPPTPARKVIVPNWDMTKIFE